MDRIGNPLPNMSNNTSFPETADIETSSDGYASRFAGPTGEWFLQVQERITLAMLRDYETLGPEERGAETCAAPGDNRQSSFNPHHATSTSHLQSPKVPLSVLDVGGGHGQLAKPLCEKGFRVTVIGSHESCRKRVAGLIESGRCEFATGNLVALPFPDRSFDAVLCFRFLPHCTQWQKLIGELCRVAKNSVIADYPSTRSFNAIAPALFDAKRKVEKNTRQWTTFKHVDIVKAFAGSGFVLHSRKSQFFVPMAVHRMLKCRGLSAGVETLCRLTGLTALFGSPTIIEMRRKTL